MATPAARPAKVRCVSLSLDREALAILHAEAPSQKAHGRFLSRLLYEHQARQKAHAEILQLYGLQPATHEAVMEE